MGNQQTFPAPVFIALGHPVTVPWTQFGERVGDSDSRGAEVSKRDGKPTATAVVLPRNMASPLHKRQRSLKSKRLTFNKQRKGKGTKEWSDASYNICIGCEHGCLYCYAKALTCRFQAQMRRPGVWDKQRLNPNRKAKGAEVGAKGVVMFPTTHDITPTFLKESLETIKNLLEDNHVLVVSKPHLKVVRALCKALTKHKEKLMFRFTIGSPNQSTCAFWEPGAPPPRERIAALKHAFKQGFKTSVSIEPMLEDSEETCRLVEVVDPFVTDTIWIGKMQRIPEKYNGHVKGFKTARKKIKSQQTDPEICSLVEALSGQRKVRWKDSIQKVMERY